MIIRINEWMNKLNPKRKIVTFVFAPLIFATILEKNKTILIARQGMTYPPSEYTIIKVKGTNIVECKIIDTKNQPKRFSVCPSAKVKYLVHKETDALADEALDKVIVAMIIVFVGTNIRQQACLFYDLRHVHSQYKSLKKVINVIFSVLISPLFCYPTA